jgi:hypothetical protein
MVQYCLCGTDPDDQALAAPKLNVVAVHQPLGFLDWLGIVAADQRLKAYEMPVASDGISPVFDHPESPLTDGQQ